MRKAKDFLRDFAELLGKYDVEIWADIDRISGNPKTSAVFFENGKMDEIPIPSPICAELINKMFEERES